MRGPGMTEGARWALPALVVLGFALRAYGAARAHLTFDESIVWAFAREIRLRPLHLVSRTADHPLLNAYLVRASHAVFGDGDLGLRLLHVTLGAAGILVVYHLGRHLWGVRAGVAAAGLLALDPFHLSWSRLIIEEGPLLLAESLALLFLWRGLSRGRVRDFLWAGVCVGAACLLKETALLLLPGLFAGLAWTARGRAALRTRGPVLALLAALLPVAFDLGWYLAHGGGSHWQRAAGILAEPPGLTLKASSLYLGDLYRGLVGPDVLDADYADGQAYATAWPLGLAYLGAVAAALRRRDENDRLLAPVFLIVFVAATVVDGARRFDPFWWASLSLVPALLLLAREASRAWEARAWAAPALVAGLALLAAYDVSWLRVAGTATPRLTRQEWAARIAEDGEALRAHGDVEAAREQARQALLLDSTNASARALLARLP